MRKKRALSFLLAVCMVIPMLAASGLAVGTADEAYKAKEIPSNYFYQQLNDRAKAIYTKLLTEFQKGEEYYEGTKFIDLIEVQYGEDAGDKAGQEIISTTDINNYKAGNKDIFNDFCAAKDALDLDHSELWWMDSGYLSFQVTENGGQYHVLVGPGRGKTYLLAGQTTEDIAKLGDGMTVKSMNEAVEKAISDIVDKAVDDLNKNDAAKGFSQQDKISYLVSSVHDSITKGIHYRYETECRENGKYAKYIRTLYGLVSHEGVCEAYARTLQVALTKLGIECVLIHGVQSKGTPEDHMWNAVNIPDDEENDHWYVVDATWDDPLVAKYDGSRDLEFKSGLDGNETNTYLLVGQSTVGEYWHPSGYVSTGNFEFKYPTIETGSYSGATVYGDDSGLKIQYSAGASMEDNIPAGVFAVTYKGMDAAAARAKGLYFMVKMYDYHQDGTADVMDEWYYADATFVASSENPYFGDYGGTLRISTATCEYIEIAVTTRKPDGRDTWEKPADSGENELTNSKGEAGYFHGSESEIIAQSGMLYNVNSKYEAPPYVLTQYPAPNGNATAGYTYRFKVIYDDLLYHVLPTDQNAASGIATVDPYEDNYEQARTQTVQVRYTTDQQDLHDNYAVKFHQVVGELNFDKDRDGVVDMDAATNDKVNFKWIYASDKLEDGGQGIVCPNTAYHKTHTTCDVKEGCPIVGVEFDFRASDQWIDDVTQYTFIMEGLVGSRSNKYPNNFSVIATVPGLCPACYRSQGIDWNLWGQPTLLDAPENLDLASLASAEDNSDEAKAALEAFNDQIHRDEMNGRLMLVVEDKSKGAGSREDYEKINDALTGEGGELAGKEVAFSSVFEINFNRVCPMVKLQPNKGQSLRVQVGYPAGITYETLSQYELSAYHFTRCGAEINDEKPCPNAGKPGHKWGDDIVSTEKIDLIPTPYGIVIMCEAFSPFELVAVKKDGTALAAAEETTHNVIVVAGENGKVKIDGVEAVGKNGNQKVDDSGTLQFTVEPATGYVVDTVSFGGDTECIQESGGTYTLSGVNKSDVLSVTFAPQEVKEQETKTYGAAVVAKACAHLHTSPLKDAEHQEDKDPTCTEAGYKLGTVCNDCNQVVTQGQVIPATGHVHTHVETEAKAATCKANGTTAVYHCDDCKQNITTVSTVQALGHSFTDYRKDGAATCEGQPYTAKCDRCQATETLYDVSEKVEHRFTVEQKDKEKAATCTSNQIKVMKCQWCDLTEEQEVAGTQLKHQYNEDTHTCKLCGAFSCEGGHTRVIDPAVAATCTTDGKTQGSHCSVCGHVFEHQTVIPALGHSYPNQADHSKSVPCTKCGAMSPTKEHTPVELKGEAATCTADGLEDGVKCKDCGDIITPRKLIPALGHDYDVEHITWTWSKDGLNTASATVACTRCAHKETFSATVTEAATKAATCEDAGTATLTATVTIGGESYTTTKTEDIPAKGHTVEEFTPNSDATCVELGTETGTCSVCGKQITQDRTELLPHSIIPNAEKSTPATCTTAGENVGTCAVCGHTGVSEEVPALGHSFGPYRTVTEATCTETGLMRASCSRCGATASYTTPALGHTFEDGECTRCGQPEVERQKHPVVNTYDGFKDVPAGEWYEEDLKFAVERNLILGTDVGEFSPEEDLTRVQWMILLARFDFQDAGWSDEVNDDSMAWAMEKGITDGSDPQGSITREQLVTMLWRYFDCPESDEDISAYADADTVSDYALTAFRWAVGKGIIRGVSATELGPQQTALRCQAAVIFSRFVKDIEGE